MQSIVILYHPRVLICRYLENISRLFSTVQETLVHHPYHRCKSFIFEGLSCWNILQDTNSCYRHTHKTKSINFYFIQLRTNFSIHHLHSNSYLQIKKKMYLSGDTYKYHTNIKSNTPNFYPLLILKEF